MLDLGIVDVEENDFGLSTKFLMTCGCIVVWDLYPAQERFGLIQGTPDCPRGPHPSVEGERGAKMRSLASRLRIAGWAREVLG